MTERKPRLAVRALKPVLAGLTALDHRTEPLLDAAGIPADLLYHPDAYLPPGAMTSLWDRALEATGDDYLGLHVAAAAPVESFDMHAYALLSSPTLRDAYVRGCRYQRLISDVTELTFREEGGHGTLRHGLPDGRSVSRHPAEFLAATWLRLGRLVTGTEWTPLAVSFAHEPPSETGPLEEAFGAPVRFVSGRTAMDVPVALLDAPNPRADAALGALMDRYADSLLERIPDLDATGARVREWLVAAHGEGAPLARDAARVLGMSERTLHRRLREEGTTFRRLLDGFRHEKAMTLLASDRYGIAETAFLLGYSELSAFYRAFRRWTGRSPAAVREEALGRGRTPG